MARCFTSRFVGRARAAHEAVDGLAERLARVEVADTRLAGAGAAVKAEGGLSYANAFAAATAEMHRAPLLSGDPEITTLERSGLEVVDLTKG